MKCNNKAAAKRSFERKKANVNKNKEFTDKLKGFYKIAWDSIPNKVCYETGVPIYTFNKWHIHHVLEKKYYPEHIFNTDVCILLTLEMHALWHSIAPSDRSIKMPKTWAKYNELLNKYTNE